MATILTAQYRVSNGQRSCSLSIFGAPFDRPLDDACFPSKLERMGFSTFFNQPLNGVRLPRALKILELGLVFDQPLQGVDLPNGLEAIVLSEMYNGSLDDLHLPQHAQVCRWYYASQMVEMVD